MKNITRLCLFYFIVVIGCISIQMADAIPVLQKTDQWTITASSVEEPHVATHAADGLRATRWSSEFQDHQWWAVDFGEEQMINRLLIRWEDAYAKSYKVLVSADGARWTEVFSQPNGQGGEEWITLPAPVSARQVKIECLSRATKWGFSIIDVIFNPPLPMTGTATASSGDGDYAPKFAIDGNMSTRWSSGFNDADWWQIKFDKPRIISGLRISWETAFAEKYEIAVSMDGQEWQTVYKVQEGDGQTDLLFFKPVGIQYLRIVCQQRGTGWGNSIWEIKFFDGDSAPLVSASSFLETKEPALALDGDPATAWHSDREDEPSLKVQLPAVMNLGGLELLWGKEYAKQYTLETSLDGEAWVIASEEKNGNGERDYVFFPAREAQFVRLTARRSSAGQGVSLANIEFKSGEEQATPIRDYQARARDMRRGLFPMWLTRQQEFWTVTGVPGDAQESLLGETGTFEPFKGAFSVQPFLLADDQVFSWADVTLEQHLEEDYLPMPSVHWVGPGWSLDISAITFGEPGQTMAAVRYRFSSTGAEAVQGQLALAIRPVQLSPVWQHGGMSPIHTAVCETNPTSALVLNGKTQVILTAPPAAMGANALKDGDTADYLLRGDFPVEQKAGDPDGKTGASVLYALRAQPGQPHDVVLLFPLQDEATPPEQFADHPSAAFEAVWARQKAAWESALNVVQLDIPEDRLIRVLKSNLAYVLINHDAPWFKPGSRNYNHSWMRDGALTGVAMLRMGHPELPGGFIRAFTGLIQKNGLVPYMILENGQPIGSDPEAIGGEGQEYDSQGQYPFIVRQYVDFTGDTNLLRQVYPQVVKALQFAKGLRRHRMTTEYKENPDKAPYYGILPESNSHEGYYPAKHSYWDGFWYLKGLQDGAALADQLGQSKDAAWMRAEENEARKDLYASILEVIRRHHMSVIPGCVELGDIDPTSTTIAIMAADEKDVLPQPYANNTFDLYFTNFSRRLDPSFVDTFTPYEVRNADVFVRLGQRERALTMLRYFTSQSTRPQAWNHMAEVVHAKLRAPSYIGDMPHTWVGSDYINAVRSIFAYEQGERLVLAAGVDPVWLSEGVKVGQLPTLYGTINYTFLHQPATSNEPARATFKATGSAVPPGGFEVPLPETWNVLRAEANGESISTEGHRLRFTGLPASIQMELKAETGPVP